MEPSWDDLRIFLSLAREGTLTTAAKALGVSHPTVARRVQALEKQIGARLFDRLPDRFVPTAAGRGAAGRHRGDGEGGAVDQPAQRRARATR